MGKTIKQIIQRLDRQKINCFSEEDKLGWIGELDGRIALEVCLMDVVQVQEFNYAYPQCLDHEPLIPFPYDGLYDLYLAAMIDFKHGEYDKYQNTMAQFEEQLDAFTVWFLNTYKPSQGYGEENG